MEISQYKETRGKLNEMIHNLKVNPNTQEIENFDLLSPRKREEDLKRKFQGIVDSIEITQEKQDNSTEEAKNSDEEEEEEIFSDYDIDQYLDNNLMKNQMRAAKIKEQKQIANSAMLEQEILRDLKLEQHSESKFNNNEEEKQRERQLSRDEEINMELKKVSGLCLDSETDRSNTDSPLVTRSIRSINLEKSPKSVRELNHQDDKKEQNDLEFVFDGSFLRKLNANIQKNNEQHVDEDLEYQQALQNGNEGDFDHQPPLDSLPSDLNNGYNENTQEQRNVQEELDYFEYLKQMQQQNQNQNLTYNSQNYYPEMKEAYTFPPYIQPNPCDRNSEMNDADHLNDFAQNYDSSNDSRKEFADNDEGDLGQQVLLDFLQKKQGNAPEEINLIPAEENLSPEMKQSQKELKNAGEAEIQMSKNNSESKEELKLQEDSTKKILSKSNSSIKTENTFEKMEINESEFKLNTISKENEGDDKISAFSPTGAVTPPKTKHQFTRYAKKCNLGDEESKDAVSQVCLKSKKEKKNAYSLIGQPQAEEDQIITNSGIKIVVEKKGGLVFSKFLYEEGSTTDHYQSVVYKDDKIFDQPKKALYAIKKINN